MWEQAKVYVPLASSPTSHYARYENAGLEEELGEYGSWEKTEEK